MSHNTLLEVLRSEEAIKRLGAQGNLFWNGKKIVVDPFTPALFLYEVDEAFHVTGKFRWATQEAPLAACEGVFPGIMIHHSVLRFVEADWKWVSYVYPQPKPIDRAFLEQCQRDSTAPEIVWKRPLPDPLPVLVLNDRTGAFANLWMDYGVLGRSPINEKAEAERFWEKDLLETAFIKKQVGSSRYYCPLDKVGKSLTFLLEIGWTILDFQGKKVVRQGAQALEAVKDQDALILRGKVSYGEHQADLTRVLGAFNRRERFLDLSPDVVGLIEERQGWVDLSQEEMDGSGIKVRRAHFGLLEEMVRLPEGYQLSEWRQTLPAPSFRGTLYSYQQQGVDWLSYLYCSGFHGVLADEMGLGKTVQLLAFFSTLVLQQPILIVMPRSLLFNWKREFDRFLPEWEVYVHSGSGRLQNLEGKRVILTSYAVLRQDRMLFESGQYSCVVLDEAQAIKNSDSLTAQIACRLNSRFRLAVTGTPVENRWEDLWSLFHFAMPELLGEKKESPLLERVRKKIRPFTLRRMKRDVDLNLPPKLEQAVWVDLDEGQREYYDQFLARAKGGLMQKVAHDGAAKHRMEILEAILRLRQICCCPQLVSGEAPEESGKLERLMADLEEAVLGQHKVLVYSQFTAMLRLIEKRVREKGWGYAYLDGQTENREKEVEQFQNDPDTLVFLISLKAGGVGLNLTAADYVFLFDPWWNEAVENQAIDRAHRVGREKPVIARRYIAVETIEEKIIKVKDHKRALARGLLDFEDDIGPVSSEDLYDLLIF
jgi:SNF2 family DNA or RNA helicase